MMGQTSAWFGIVFLLVGMITGCSANAKGKDMVVSGTIRIVGNEPFTSVVIRSQDPRERDSDARDTVVTGPLTKELRQDFQGKSVTLVGSECNSPSPRFKKCIKPGKIMID